MIFLIALIIGVHCRTKEEWRGRTVYQLLTDRFGTSKGASSSCDLHNYCGGDFQGIIDHLDYISNLGFDAIWISPVIDNYDKGYHGYHGRDLYKINDKFGTSAQLKALVAACHAKNIWVMVDIVANHMGNTNEVYTQNNPFNQSDHYHTRCEITDNDFNTKNLANIERCRLSGLADLNQDNSFVADQLITWIKWLVKEYSFDGMRIDTVMMVKTTYWKKFTAAAGIYQVGEVFDGDINFLKQFLGGMDGLLNYPLFYKLRSVFFKGENIGNLESFYTQLANSFGKSNIPYMGNFNDNHDNARFLSDEVRSNITNEKINFSALKKLQFQAITAFTLTSIGIPMIYYGSEQLYAGGSDPYNREILWNHLDQHSEMYKFIQTINQARKNTNAGAQDQIQRYSDSEIYAFTRGYLFAAFSNKYDRKVIKQITYHPYAEGTTLCNIFYLTDCVKIAQGKFLLYLDYGEIKILVPK